MKVSDVMQRYVISVPDSAPLKEVSRLIFSLGIAGVPVVKNKKLVGIVTEHDILSKMFPSIQDVVEDYAHARDFENMEKNLVDLLETPVRQIMNRNVTSISQDMPLMEAQSIMLLHKFSRVPIVDKEGNLIGIISQGDIFRQILKNEMPRLQRERYAGFVARHYDVMVNWEKRFEYEFPSLLEELKRVNANKVIDLGSWTGEYSIGLAKKGLSVLGVDNNDIMIKISRDKKEKLPLNIRKNVEFMLTNYSDFSSYKGDKFDALVCMGNSLPYIPVSPSVLFKEVSSLLNEKKAVVILQLLNQEKVLRAKNRLLSFKIQKSTRNEGKEHLFIEFFDKEEGDFLLHNVIIFDSDGKNWIFKGTTTVQVSRIRKDDIEKILKKSEFSNISFSGGMGEYQGEYGKLSFKEPFDEEQSDWLNVLAKR